MYTSQLKKKKDNCENIYSVNYLYLIIGKVDGHIEEQNKSKYSVFNSTDEIKEVFKKSCGMGKNLGWD